MCSFDIEIWGDMDRRDIKLVVEPTSTKGNASIIISRRVMEHLKKDDNRKVMIYATTVGRVNQILPIINDKLYDLEPDNAYPKPDV